MTVQKDTNIFRVVVNGVIEEITMKMRILERNIFSITRNAWKIALFLDKTSPSGNCIKEY